MCCNQKKDPNICDPFKEDLTDFLKKGCNNFIHYLLSPFHPSYRLFFNTDAVAHCIVSLSRRSTPGIRKSGCYNSIVLYENGISFNAANSCTHESMQ